MSELISGKEAFDAAYNGCEAQWRWTGKDVKWRELEGGTVFSINELKGGACEFRLKPRTITINGIELAPCYAVGIDHTKNEVSIQFHNNEDAVKLNNLLLNIYGFRNA